MRKLGGNADLKPAEVNGQPAFVVFEEEPIGVVVLDIAGGDEPKISGIRIVVNPDKLSGVKK